MSEINLEQWVGKAALFILRGGEQGYTHIRKEDGQYLMRYEHGWYVEYTKDGKRVSGGNVYSKNGEFKESLPPPHRRDIVEIKECEFQVGMRGGFTP